LSLQINISQEPVAQAWNPSYSGGRDQEDQGLKPVQANSSQEPISKKNQHKIGLVEWLEVGPEFKPQYREKKKKKFLPA
jgi:pSer/pThr/pTyr-binding forkhead associated (FHA) protein